MTPMPVRESGAKRSRTRRFMSAPPYAGGGEMQGGGGSSSQFEVLSQKI